MGFTPREVDQMALWEFNACVAGVNEANGAEPAATPPTPEQHDDAIRRWREKYG
jgi:hypothetical protein